MSYSQRTVGSRHLYRRKFQMHRASTEVSKVDDATYTTRCNHISSSWKIVVKLLKDPPFGNFRMRLDLQRSDGGSHPLNGKFQVWLLDIHGKKCTTSYRIRFTMTGGQQVGRLTRLHNDQDCDYRCLFSEGGLTFPADVLVVKYLFEVKSCHRRPEDQAKSAPGVASSDGQGTSKMVASKL